MDRAVAGPSVGHAATAAGWPLSFAIAAIAEDEVLAGLWVCGVGGVVVHSDSRCGWSGEEEDEKGKEEEEEEEEEEERQEGEVSADTRKSSLIQSHSKSI